MSNIVFAQFQTSNLVPMDFIGTIGQAKKALIHDHVDHCLTVAGNGRGSAARDAVNEFKAISKYL